MITVQDKERVKEALELALKAGAQKARVSYVRSEEDIVATLNGEIDKVTHSCDHSMSFALFVDGRYGVFSTNKLTPAALKDFLSSAVQIVRTITADEYRDLPAPERYCTTAKRGDELGLVDPTRSSISPKERLQAALDACIFGTIGDNSDWHLISEEGEYSDSICDNIIMDSNGLSCAHTECSFDYCVETTIEANGEKYSSYAWDSSSSRSGLDAPSCGQKALNQAIAQIGAEAVKSGKYTMVVDSEVASRLVSPVLKALNAYGIQQNNSFLMGSLGKELFPKELNIVDKPHIKGQTCSKLYDSEGVATSEKPIIKDGVVCQWFVNTYMSAKLGMAPTNEDATRPCLLPFPKDGLNAASIMQLCGEGIYVTGFNGGNNNAATGDFSYGVEGFLFKDGVKVKAISGMLITGNFLELYQNMIAAGSDARSCMSKLIPTLAFRNVDFSGN